MVQTGGFCLGEAEQHLQVSPMFAHLRVPQTLPAPQAPRPPQCRSVERAGTLLLAAVFRRNFGAQPPAETGDGAGGACCWGGWTDRVPYVVLLAPSILWAVAEEAAGRTVAWVRGGGAAPRQQEERRSHAPEPRTKRKAKCWYPPAGAGAEALAPAVVSALASAPPSNSASTSASGFTERRLPSAESCGASAPGFVASQTEASRQRPQNAAVSFGLARGRTGEEATPHWDADDALCAKAVEWTIGVVPVVPPPKGTRRAAAAPAAPAWSAYVDPHLTRALWAAAGRPPLQEMMELMEDNEPCGAWKEYPYMFVFKNFLSKPWTTAFQRHMREHLGGYWSAAQMLARLALDSVQEEQRKKILSHVEHFLVVDSALVDSSALGVQPLGVLCDVYRAAVGLDRVEEELGRLARAVAQAPPGRPQWEYKEGSGNCFDHVFSVKTCIELGCATALANPPPEGFGLSPAAVKLRRELAEKKRRRCQF